MTSKVVESFDVFDTLITRKLDRPEDVFRLLYRRLVSVRLLDPNLLDEDEFLSLRRQAQSELYRTREEGSLDTIWDWMARRFPELTSPEFQQAELETERTVFFPIPSGVDLVRAARARGSTICFISDTYLPEDFLLEVLTTFAIIQPAEKLFVSSAYGRIKRTGRLFSVVLDYYQISPGKLRHTGDTLAADIRPARAMGIRTRLFARPTENDFDRRIAAHPSLKTLEQSVLLGTLKHSRISPKIQPGTVARLVASFYGPACLVWALWCLRTAEAHGVRTIYFSARDAYLPYRAAMNLVSALGLRFECHYLEASRYSLASATIFEPKRDQLEWWLAPKWESLSAKRVLERLSHLGCHDHPVIEEWFHGCKNREQITVSDKDNLLRLLEQDELGNHVVQNSTILRQRFVDYLRTRGFVGNHPVLLCDIGWRMNTSRALRQMRASLSLSTDVISAFLFFNERRLFRDEAGFGVSMCGQVPSAQERSRLRDRVPKLAWLRDDAVEDLLSLAPHGTTRGYEIGEDKMARPVFGPITPRDLRFRKAVGECFEEYAQEHCGIFFEAFQTADQCKAAFRQLTDVFIATPPADSLGPLIDRTGSCELAQYSSHGFISPYTTLDVVRQFMPRRLLKGRRVDKTWHEASLVASPVLLRPVVRRTLALRKWLATALRRTQPSED